MRFKIFLFLFQISQESQRLFGSPEAKKTRRNKLLFPNNQKSKKLSFIFVLNSELVEYGFFQEFSPTSILSLFPADPFFSSSFSLR